jgi:hypothetical protein
MLQRPSCFSAAPWWRCRMRNVSDSTDAIEPKGDGPRTLESSSTPAPPPQKNFWGVVKFNTDRAFALCLFQLRHSLKLQAAPVEERSRARVSAMVLPSLSAVWFRTKISRRRSIEATCASQWPCRQPTSRRSCHRQSLRPVGPLCPLVSCLVGSRPCLCV